MKDQFYRQTTLQVLERLKATPQGLLTTEAMERLQKNGPNELPQGKKVTLWQRIIAQFKDLMILILIVAAIVAAFAGELSDTIIILLVVILNAAFGVFQETKAENAIDALQKMSTPTTRVRRDGQIAQLSSKELVVGDVILLEAGDIIPADVRFLKTQNVKVEEAALTGESVAVTKDEAVIDAESAALGDRHNMG
ncbi:HAD-IC family P-type ATPase, partial [Limosilactobacillus mucosae]|nr:HAD-IC family P-type ATPase [Limosilactobacillus mucosae]